MRKLDAIVVLGSRIGLRNGVMVPARHTLWKIKAASVAYHRHLGRKLILSGGFNFSVRYDQDLSAPAYNSGPGSKMPDFSETARRQARFYRSEASVMAECLIRDFSVLPEDIILEEESATTAENASECLKIVNRLFYGRNGSSPDIFNVGVIALLYHMPRAYVSFLNELIKIGADTHERIKIIPLFAEDLLMLEDTRWLDAICHYYREPRGNEKWDTKLIRQILTNCHSIGSIVHLAP